MCWLQEAGFNLWYDEGIQLGSVWRRAIADALTATAGMLFVATKSSVESDHCLKELSFALDEGKPVFVVQLDDTKLPSLLRLSLADRQMLNRADFDETTYRARLIQALGTVARPAPRAPGEADKSQRIVTTVPSIGLQILSAGDEGKTAFWAESLIDNLATLLVYRSFGITTTHDATKDQAQRARPSMDVSYVVSGNVRHADDRYRVNLKLTKGGSGRASLGLALRRAEQLDRRGRRHRTVAAVDISAAIFGEGRSESAVLTSNGSTRGGCASAPPR